MTEFLNWFLDRNGTAKPNLPSAVATTTGLGRRYLDMTHAVDSSPTRTRLGARLLERPDGNAKPSPRVNTGAAPQITPDCARALAAAAGLSAKFGLPFSDGGKNIALRALGTGVPAALRLTKTGMRHAKQFVHDNPGLLTGATRYGPGLTAYQTNFGADAYGGAVNGPRRGNLGAQLGRATVILDAGGNVVGVKDQFDYDPANHRFPVSWGVRRANNGISAACKSRVPFVPVRGGVVR